MVVVMVGHLGIGHPALCGVCEVEPAANPAVLLQRLHDTDPFAKPEKLEIEREKKLREEGTEELVAQIVKPVVLVCVARKWMRSPVVNRVNVLPQIRVDMQGTVQPVHGKAQCSVV